MKVKEIDVTPLICYILGIKATVDWWGKILDDTVTESDNKLIVEQMDTLVRIAQNSVIKVEER